MHYELRTNRLWRTSIDVRDGIIIKAVTTENKGASARVLTKGKWGFCAHSGDTDSQSIIKRAKKASKASPPQNVVLADTSPVHTEILSNARFPPHTTELDEKIDALYTLIEDSGLQDNPSIDHYYLGFNDYFSIDRFENSEESLIESEEAATGIIFALMGNTVREGFLIAPYGLEFLREKRVINKLQQKMESLPQNVKSPPSGKYDIVFSPDVTGILIHEVVGHGLEADKVLREDTALAQSMGDAITCEEFTCIDDPLLENAFGRYEFDDEGVPAAGTCVIDRGVLQSLLHSRETAGALSCEPTGNALAESVLYPPLVRTSNIRVQPGDATVDELCENADIYIDSLGAVELQYEHDFLSFIAESGTHLKEGYTMREINIRINVGEILSHLKGVGKKRELVTRHCSKGRQFIPSSTLTPPLLFSNVEVIS